jgi:two-component system sensor histidine kinase PilS (NtrC family)
MKPTLKYYQSTPLGRRFWFLVMRFIIPALLVGSGLVFLRPIAFNNWLIIFYSIFSVALFIYAISSKNSSESVIRALVIASIAGELLIESLLVNHVGGNFSPFVIFFIITIVTASIFFHLPGSIMVATFAGLLYALPIFFDLSSAYEGLIQSTHLAGQGVSSDEAFYTVFLHLCLFYFCAFISGYLAQNLFWASRELNKIRLETNEILEQMHSGLITFDARGAIIYFNRAAGEILGVDHELAKSTEIDLFSWQGLQEFSQKIDTSLKSGRSDLRAEINIRHPHKGIVPIGLSLSALKDESGRARGVIAIFQDLTEAKKLEAHLRASDRLAAVGKLAAGIAHEIRNPLASISGSVEVLKDDLELEGDDLRLLELILKESSRLNTILSDFLNFARVTKVPSGKADLTSVIREVATLATAHHKTDKPLHISYDIHRPDIMVWSSEDQLKQILWNLVINAIQALDSLDDGEIKISTEESTNSDIVGTVCLTVADNGQGIPENIKEKIFEPFFSTKGNGTGLGLPIVARIVDCLGGRIEITSSENWKTIFRVYLPLSPINGIGSTKTRELSSVS